MKASRFGLVAAAVAAGGVAFSPVSSLSSSVGKNPDLEDMLMLPGEVFALAELARSCGEGQAEPFSNPEFGDPRNDLPYTNYFLAAFLGPYRQSPVKYLFKACAGGEEPGPDVETILYFHWEDGNNLYDNHFWVYDNHFWDPNPPLGIFSPNGVVDSNDIFEISEMHVHWGAGDITGSYLNLRTIVDNADEGCCYRDCDESLDLNCSPVWCAYETRVAERAFIRRYVRAVSVNLPPLDPSCLKTE